MYDEGFPAWVKAGYPYHTLNILPKVKIPAVSGAELKAMIDSKDDIVILDIRDEKDAQGTRFSGSFNIELEDIMARYSEIPQGKKVVIVDFRGKQTVITGRYLLKQGYTDIAMLEGGVEGGWVQAGF